MQAHSIAAFLSVAVVPATCLAECTPFSAPWAFEIHESVADKNKFVQPAVISYTRPDEGAATYAIDAGITGTNVLCSYASLDPHSTALSYQWDFGASIEAHRNSHVTKEQNQLAAGISLLGAVNADKPQQLGFYPTVTIKYKEDRVAKTDSFVAIVKSGFQYPPLAMGLPVPGWKLGDFGIIWRPELGLEHERATRSQNPDLSEHASVSRTYAGIGVELRTPLRQLTFGYIGKYRRDFSKDPGAGGERRTHPYSNPFVNWAFIHDAKTDVSLRFERVTGDDPLLSLPPQSFDRVGLRVQHSL